MAVFSEPQFEQPEVAVHEHEQVIDDSATDAELAEHIRTTGDALDEFAHSNGRPHVLANGVIGMIAAHEAVHLLAGPAYPFTRAVAAVFAGQQACRRNLRQNDADFMYRRRTAEMLHDHSQLRGEAIELFKDNDGQLHARWYGNTSTADSAVAPKERIQKLVDFAQETGAETIAVPESFFEGTGIQVGTKLSEKEWLAELKPKLRIGYQRHARIDEEEAEKLIDERSVRQLSPQEVQHWADVHQVINVEQRRSDARLVLGVMRETQGGLKDQYVRHIYDHIDEIDLAHPAISKRLYSFFRAKLEQQLDDVIVVRRNGDGNPPEEIGEEHPYEKKKLHLQGKLNGASDRRGRPLVNMTNQGRIIEQRSLGGQLDLSSDRETELRATLEERTAPARELRQAAIMLGFMQARRWHMSQETYQEEAQARSMQRKIVPLQFHVTHMGERATKTDIVPHLYKRFSETRRFIMRGVGKVALIGGLLLGASTVAEESTDTVLADNPVIDAVEGAGSTAVGWVNRVFEEFTSQDEGTQEGSADPFTSLDAGVGNINPDSLTHGVAMHVTAHNGMSATGYWVFERMDEFNTPDNATPHWTPDRGYLDELELSKEMTDARALELPKEPADMSLPLLEVQKTSQFSSRYSEVDGYIHIPIPVRIGTRVEAIDLRYDDQPLSAKLVHVDDGGTQHVIFPVSEFADLEEINLTYWLAPSPAEQTHWAPYEPLAISVQEDGEVHTEDEHQLKAEYDENMFFSENLYALAPFERTTFTSPDDYVAYAESVGLANCNTANSVLVLKNDEVLDLAAGFYKPPSETSSDLYTNNAHAFAIGSDGKIYDATPAEFADESERELFATDSIEQAEGSEGGELSPNERKIMFGILGFSGLIAAMNVGAAGASALRRRQARHLRDSLLQTDEDVLEQGYMLINHLMYAPAEQDQAIKKVDLAPRLSKAPQAPVIDRTNELFNNRQLAANARKRLSDAWSTGRLQKLDRQVVFAAFRLAGYGEVKRFLPKNSRV